MAEAIFALAKVLRRSLVGFHEQAGRGAVPIMPHYVEHSFGLRFFGGFAVLSFREGWAFAMHGEIGNCKRLASIIFRQIIQDKKLLQKGRLRGESFQLIVRPFFYSLLAFWAYP